MTKSSRLTPPKDAARLRSLEARLTIEVKRSGMAKSAGKATGPIHIYAVDIAAPGLMNKCVYTENNRMDQILAGDLCDAITELVDAADRTDGNGFFPDFSLTLPGLTLSRVKISEVRKSKDGQTLRIRFAHCLGNVVAAFEKSAQPWQAGHDQTQMLAAQTLEQIFVPLINLGTTFRQEDQGCGEPANGPLRDGLRRTVQKIGELELYYNMLIEFAAAGTSGPERRTQSVIKNVKA